MPTNDLLRAVHAQDTAEVFVTLITLSHPLLDPPIRVANDTQDLVSRGETYIGFPFEFSYFNQDEQVPRGELIIQNVDRRISKAVKRVNSRIAIDIELVLFSDPDTVQFDWKSFELNNVSVNAMQVTGTVTGRDYTTEPYPYIRATRDVVPGAFIT